MEKRSTEHAPCSIDLILSFPEPHVVPNRIAQLTALEPGSTPVDNDNNILESAHEVVMPVTPILDVDLLTLRATVTVEDQKNVDTIQNPEPTRGIELGISYAQNHPF